MASAVWRTRLLLAALLVAATTAAPAGALAAECPAPREPNLAQPPQPLNIDKVKTLLRDYHAKSYSDDLAAVAADARKYVEQRAGQVKNPALVLDIDETSLTNWPNISADDFGFIDGGPCSLRPKQPCGFTAWMRKGIAKAIAPTQALFNTAKANGVKVFFITGRHEVDRKVTISNLRRAKYRGWERLVMRTDEDTKRSVEDYKTDERRKIEAKGYTIIANMGDQQSDLDGGFAECRFKLPNPFYFIP